MWTMAYSVWQKMFSNRASLLLILLGLIVLGISAAEAGLSAEQKIQAIQSRGLLVASALAILAVIFFGGTQVAQDIHDRSAMIWLSKPIPRWRYLAGRFIGACGIGWIVLAVFALGGAILLALQSATVDSRFLLALLGTALQLAVIAAILTALSTLLGYMPTAMIGGLVVLGGYATFSLPYYIMLLPHSPASWLLWLFYWLLPNWQHFSNAVERTTHWGFWVWLGAYALGQCVVYLALGIAIFHSRDIA